MNNIGQPAINIHTIWPGSSKNHPQSLKCISSHRNHQLPLIAIRCHKCVACFSCYISHPSMNFPKFPIHKHPESSDKSPRPEAYLSLLGRRISSSIQFLGASKRYDFAKKKQGFSSKNMEIWRKNGG